jgi:hypothetical protein
LSNPVIVIKPKLGPYGGRWGYVECSVRIDLGHEKDMDHKMVEARLNGKTFEITVGKDKSTLRVISRAKPKSRLK